MTLTEQINNDIKVAMKAKDKVKLSVLRDVKAKLLIAKTAEGATGDLTPEEEIKLIQKLKKQRTDAAEIYKTQGREDLYAQEAAEAVFLDPYLPQQLSDEELTLAVKEILEQLGAKSMADMGKSMGVASKKLAGKAEGRLIAAKVKELLA